MNYIPLDSYSLFIIPYNTSLFTETNEDGYKTSSISSENDDENNEDSPEFYKSSGITTNTSNTSTSSPYTVQYVSRQYRLKNNQLTWNTSTLKKENFSDINSEHINQISPVKEVSSSPI